MWIAGTFTRADESKPSILSSSGSELSSKVEAQLVSLSEIGGRSCRNSCCCSRELRITLFTRQFHFARTKVEHGFASVCFFTGLDILRNSSSSIGNQKANSCEKRQCSMVFNSSLRNRGAGRTGITGKTSGKFPPFPRVSVLAYSKTHSSPVCIIDRLSGWVSRARKNSASRSNYGIAGVWLRFARCDLPNFRSWLS